MLGGIILQLRASYCNANHQILIDNCYKCSLSHGICHFCIRVLLALLKDGPICEISTRNTERGVVERLMDMWMKIMMGALAFSSLCLFIWYVDYYNKPSP